MQAVNKSLNRSSQFLRGAKRASSIVLGYFPIGIAYGVIAVESQIDPLFALGLSILVFAGSSQFVAVSMLAAGGGPGPIVAATFLINLRHLLMSASLAPYLQTVSPARLLYLGFGITDESFALLSLDFEADEGSESYMLGVNLTAYLSWITFSAAGIFLGGLIDDPAAYGLTFALPAMFIALLVFQLKDKRDYLVGLAAALFSLLGIIYLPDNWNIIAASVLAASLGVVMGRCSS